MSPLTLAASTTSTSYVLKAMFVYGRFGMWMVGLPASTACACSFGLRTGYSPGAATITFVTFTLTHVPAVRGCWRGLPAASTSPDCAPPCRADAGRILLLASWDRASRPVE